MVTRASHDVDLVGPSHLDPYLRSNRHGSKNALRLFGCAFALVLFLITGRTYAGEKLSLPQIEIKSGPTLIKAESVEIENSSLSAEALSALLAQTDRAAHAEGLSKFNADRISIAVFRQEQVIENQVSMAIIKNISILNIKNGRAESVKTDQATFGSGDNNSAQSGNVGSIIASDVDLGVILTGGASKTVPKDEFRTAYGLIAINKIEMDSPLGPKLSIDHLTLRDFKIKSSDDGMAAIAERVIKRQERAPVNDADLNSMAADTIELLTSFSIGSGEVGKILIKDSKTSETLTINRLSYERDAADKGQKLRLDGFEGLVDGGRMRIGSLEQSGFSLTPAFSSLRTLLQKPNSKVTESNPLDLLPVIGRFEIRDVSLDFLGSPPIHAGMRALTLTFDNPEGGAPQSVSIHFEGLFGPVPSDETDPVSSALMALGYRDYNLSGSARFALDKTGKAVRVEAELSGDNIAVASINAVLGNVPTDTLWRTPQSLMGALSSSRIKEFALTLENRGIAERLVDQDAIKTKRTPDEVRKNYAAVASASLQIYLGTSPNAKVLTQSIARFIDKPAKLSITAKAKAPDGLPVTDTATVDPGVLLESFDLLIAP